MTRVRLQRSHGHRRRWFPPRETGMKHLAGLVSILGASMLVACASSPPKPEQFGFQRVALEGEEYLCGASAEVFRDTVIEGAPASVTGTRIGEHARAERLVGSDVCLSGADWTQYRKWRSVPAQWRVVRGPVFQMGTLGCQLARSLTDVAHIARECRGRRRYGRACDLNSTRSPEVSRRGSAVRSH
jgi:hypothetical protein